MCTSRMKRMDRKEMRRSIRERSETKGLQDWERPGKQVRKFGHCRENGLVAGYGGACAE